jgi:O-antigen/teichoic acid export membrane protein
MKMSRTKSFLYNSIATAFMQIVTMIVGFITPKIMLRYYGSEINGLVSSISQFIAYFNLVEAGLAGAAIYALYKPLADNNHKAINAVVSAAKRFYTQSGYIFITLTLGLAILYPTFVETDVLSPMKVGLLVLVLGVSGALEFFTLAKYRVLLTADQKTYVISLASTLSIILNTLLVVLFAHLRFSIVVLRTLVLFSVFFRSILLIVYVKNNYKYIDYREPPNNRALDKRWDALFLQILGTIHSGTPIVLATIFTNLKMVSVYSIFNMVMSGINGVLSIFISGLSSSFGEVLARQEQITLQKSYKEFEFAYYSLIAVVYSITMVTLMPFIRIYTRGITDMNYDLPLIGFLFVINGLLFSIKTPQGMLVISAGMYKETKYQTLIQGMIAVIGGIALAPKFGLTGILVSYILSNLYRDIDLIFFIPSNVTKLPVRESLYRILRMFIAIAIICIPFGLINLNLDNFYEWIVLAIMAGIYSVIVVYIMGLLYDRAEMKSIVRRLLQMIGVNR